MAVNCDPAALVAAAKCFECIPLSMQKAVELYLLAQIANGVNMAVSTDPATLVKAATCFKCVPTSMEEPVEEYLLCQIALASGA